ncbi:hypothetical protein OEA41_010406 [Lepraria neglecta]|uniref:Carrier domain-containing protein n=1 Tax=Lepraria neglecta TaxID=209136 RepID=A0AAD9YWE1_9LECA|nr:hypothetical protein OEA41_010406 [Lepraria neglecta]
MFNALIDPRVGGTINLHKALNGQPLDFFLMWSSWTAIFGTATQTNYLATCSFMDAFARHRQSLGLHATSLDLSQIFDIGAFKRVPSYANSLTRSGLYGSEAYDVLQYCDAAIASSKSITSSVSPYDPLASAQLLAGIDAILQATRNLASENSETAGKFDSSDSNATTTQRILKKLAQLLYISTDDIDVTRPISKYGIDSMVAAELRNWLFANFAKDVPLAHMLDADTSVERLEQMVHMEH